MHSRCLVQRCNFGEWFACCLHGKWVFGWFERCQCWLIDWFLEFTFNYATRGCYSVQFLGGGVWRWKIWNLSISRKTIVVCWQWSLALFASRGVRFVRFVARFCRRQKCRIGCRATLMHFEQNENSIRGGIQNGTLYEYLWTTSVLCYYTRWTGGCTVGEICGTIVLKKPNCFFAKCCDHLIWLSNVSCSYLAK